MTPAAEAPDIVNNIVYGNSVGIIDFGAQTLSIRFNDVYDNNVDYDRLPDQTGINNNISVDARFVDRFGGDYHLKTGSPVIDSGNNEGAPAEDIEGNLRPIDGNGDGTASTDMGAYEFVPLGP